MKLTRWFPPEVKPVRKGVYQVNDTLAGGAYAYWNGKAFCYRVWGKSDIPCAFEYRHRFTALPDLVEWRGLAVKP